MLSLKEFQRKCAVIKKIKEDVEFDHLMLDLLKEHEDKRLMSEWNMLCETQERFGDEYKPIVVWGGLKKDKCPCCKEDLTEHTVKSDKMWKYIISYCLNCKYSFSGRSRK